jgi:hypothetical protein
MWNAIALVTGGFTLVAFLAATGYWVYRRLLLSKETLVDSLPETERARILQDYLEAVRVDTTDLTKEQRFILAKELIAARSKTSRERALVLTVFGFITAGVSGFAIAWDQNALSSTKASTTTPAVTPTQAQMMPSPIQHGPASESVARTLLVRGSVRDADTAAPIAAANIHLRSPVASQTHADANGDFSFELVASVAELPISLEVAAEGYGTASQTIAARGSATDFVILLRSVASSRFRGIRGQWESVLEDKDMSLVARLYVADGTASTERSGTLDVTMTAKEDEQFAGGPFGPNEPCRIAIPILLSYTHDALWMHMGRRTDYFAAGTNGQLYGAVWRCRKA